MRTRRELPPSDMGTLMAALSIAGAVFSDVREYEAMRQRILASSAVVIETPCRELNPDA